MRKDIVEFINRCDTCAKWKAGHRVIAPLGEALEAHKFLDVVSLDVVGPVPVTQ
jgi:hypothetical protein